MKKFITYVSQQPKEQLVKGEYKSPDGIFKCDFEASFPVLIMMNSFVEEGEKIELTALVEKDNDNCKNNMEVLKAEVDELKKIKDFQFEIKEILVSGDETNKEQLRTFEKLLNSIKDGDELNVCATYGTKPIPIIEMMAVNAAVKIKKGVSIGCVSYGRAVRDNTGAIKELVIYDITSLFLMNRLVDSIAEAPRENAEDVIKRLLEENEDD